MKPKHNRKMCPLCGKQKMIFETKEKAENFIKYNGNDLLKGNKTIDDLRVYYCEGCLGYHISSKPFKVSYKNDMKKLIKAFNLQNVNNSELDEKLKLLK